MNDSEMIVDEIAKSGGQLYGSDYSRRMKKEDMILQKSGNLQKLYRLFKHLVSRKTSPLKSSRRRLQRGPGKITLTFFSVIVSLFQGC